MGASSRDKGRVPWNPTPGGKAQWMSLTWRNAHRPSNRRRLPLGMQRRRAQPRKSIGSWQRGDPNCLASSLILTSCGRGIPHFELLFPMQRFFMRSKRTRRRMCLRLWPRSARTSISPAKARSTDVARWVLPPIVSRSATPSSARLRSATPIAMAWIVLPSTASVRSKRSPAPRPAHRCSVACWSAARAPTGR